MVHRRGIVPLCKGLSVVHQSLFGTTVILCCGVLHQLDYASEECQVLILVPTYNLAQETKKVIEALGRFLGVKAHACTGGTSAHTDRQTLSSRVHVLIGTPGCILGMLQRHSLRPDHIRMLVLDEADELLRGGSKDQIVEIRKVIMFLNTKDKVMSLAEELGKHYTESASHDDMDQHARDIAIQKLESGSSTILIATDLRGTKEVQVPIVINYDMPTQLMQYIHRVQQQNGQSGRRSSVVINFATPADDCVLFDIQRFCDRQLMELPTNI
ncbi:hypothetical protein C2845_PM12G07010 [Panicum miliaceum]|uniref:RNA helicase n=1 Tax=Panicum miliaceum TaxID=4540 RepID=A0A3L6QLH9_PANMI|nr:hypothetical protein C2845_PM12G07010 [Panicum miliaceum]